MTRAHGATRSMLGQSAQRLFVALFAAAVILLGWSLGSAALDRLGADAGLLDDIAEACATDNPYFATACYWPVQPKTLPAHEQPVVVLSRDTPRNAPQYAAATAEQVGAVYGIAFHPTEPALYASAYHKREKAFGPGGPGAIYRIDLATGAVDHWATVPNAGPDRHFFGRLRDRDAVLWVGKTSLGDLDISADGRELYVANPADRRIYRLAVDANAGVLVQPMPELADVAFGPSGEMVLGLRGRLLDTAVTQSSAGAPA